MAYFIYNFFGSLCSYFSYALLLPDKLPILKKLTLFLFIFICNCYLIQYWGQSTTFFAIGGAILLVGIFTHFDLFSMSCSLWGYFYSVTCNYLFLWLAEVLFHISVNDLSSSLYLTTAFSILFCIFCGVTIKLIGYFIHKKYHLKQFISEKHLLRLIFCIIFLMVVFYIVHISYGESLGYSPGIIAFNGLVFMNLFLLTSTLLYWFSKKMQADLIMKDRITQYENLQEYTRSLEDAYGLMRQFKHDYINILTTLSGFIEDKNMSGLSDYYINKIMPLSNSFIQSDTKLDSLKNVKNTELKSLLSSKLIFAMELGLHIDIEIQESIDRFPVDTLDLSRILGIYLDNAIEAALRTDEKSIRYCMLYKKRNLFILVENSSQPLAISLDHINDRNTSEKGAARGLGLYNVTDILNKYPHTIRETSYKDGYFTQTLLFEES